MANIMWSSSYTTDGLIKYFRNEKDGQAKGTRYLLAEGVNGALPMIAEHQFRDVRRKWGKDGRTKRRGKFGSEYVGGQYVQAYHGIMSFGRDELDPESPDDWVRAMRIARALIVDRFPTRQAVLFLQADGTGGNLHVHAAVNSVDKESGRSIDSSVVTHSRKERQADGTYALVGMAADFDRILAAQGFLQRADLVAVMDAARDRASKGGSARLRGKVRVEKSEERALLRYQAWEASREAALLEGQPFDEDAPFSVAVMKQRIQEALASPYSVDHASFEAELLERSVQVGLPGQTGRAGVSYAMLDDDGLPLPMQKRRGAKLGEEFMLEAVDLRLAENAALVAGHAVSVEDAVQPVRATQDQVQPEVPTESEQDYLAAEMRAAIDDAITSAGADSEDDLFSQLVKRGVWVDFPHQSGEDDMVYSVLGDDDDQPIASESRRGAELGEGYGGERIAANAASAAAEHEAAMDAYMRSQEAQSLEAQQSAALAEQVQADALPDDAVPDDAVQADAVPVDAVQADAVHAGTEPPAPATAPAGEKPSATAPDFSRSADPAAQAPTQAQAAAQSAPPAEPEFRSRLRGYRLKSGNARQQEVVDAFGPFEERSRRLLLAGERVPNDEVPKGIGANFIKAFSEQMSPEVLQMLELREAKKALRSALHAEHSEAYRQLAELQAEADERGDLAMKHGPEAQALLAKHDAAKAARERLDRELRLGDYEVVPDEIRSQDGDLLSKAGLVPTQQDDQERRPKPVA